MPEYGLSAADAAMRAERAKGPIAMRGAIQPPLFTLEPDDVHVDAPTYEFSGFNVAGESAVVCGQCGGLLKESSQPTHTHWHAQLNTVLAAYAGKDTRHG